MNKGFTPLENFTKESFYKKGRNQKFLTGFTILELFVTVAIIGILSSALFLARGEAEKKLALGRSIYQLAQNLREVQEMAMGAKEAGCGTHDFGVYLAETSLDSYIIFADCNNDWDYDSNQEFLKEIKLGEGVEIYNLETQGSSVTTLNIVFSPPDPTTYINGDDWGADGIITLSFNSTFKTVEINSAGRIKIE